MQASSLNFDGDSSPIANTPQAFPDMYLACRLNQNSAEKVSDLRANQARLDLILSSLGDDSYDFDPDELWRLSESTSTTTG